LDLAVLLFTLPPKEEQLIAMSMSVCLSVCLSLFRFVLVFLQAYLRNPTPCMHVAAA